MKPEEIRKTYQVDLPELTPLERALLKAGTPILNHSDVAEYREEKLALAIRKDARSRELSRCVLLPLCCTLVAFWCYDLAVAGLPAVAAVALALSVSTGCAVALLDLGVRQRLRPLAWRRYPVGYSCCKDSPVGQELGLAGRSRFLLSDLSWTQTRIPAELKERCLDLHRAGASCAFELEQLDRDPFLWAVYNREEFCIGVFDERYVG